MYTNKIHSKLICCIVLTFETVENVYSTPAMAILLLCVRIPKVFRFVKVLKFLRMNEIKCLRMQENEILLTEMEFSELCSVADVCVCVCVCQAMLHHI
jgi:hypothetical protein